MGCSPLGPADGDGGADASESDADSGSPPDGALDIVEPAPPAAPVLTPCPEGWRELSDPDSGQATCDPWPASGPEACGVDEAHLPGEPGCLRLGTQCPEGDWNEAPPDGAAVLYVKAGTEPGGDGSRPSPYGTIAQAMTEASAGTILLLSKGTFDEEVELKGGVTLLGACVAQTRLASSDRGEWVGTVTVAGREAQVKNLQIGGSRVGIVAVGAAYSLHVEDVATSSTEAAGWFVSHGAAVTGHNVTIRNTRSREEGLLFGHGIEVQRGGSLVIDSATVEGNRGAGIQAIDPGTTVDLAHIVLRETLSEEGTGRFGRGLNVQDGAQATVIGSVFDGNRDRGVALSGAESSLSLVDSLINDTQGEQGDASGGIGLSSTDGASLNASRVVIDGNRTIGVYVMGQGATLELEDAVVRSTLGSEVDGSYGRGLDVELGAQATVRRVIFETNREIGVYVGSEGTSLLLEDIVVRDTAGRRSDGEFGRGLNVQLGGEAMVRRALFEGNREASIVVRDQGSVLELEDAVVRQTLERTCASDGCQGFGAGDGLMVLCGGRAELSRFELADNARCGILLAPSHRPDGEGRIVPCEVGGVADLREGLIAINVVGVNVQTEDFDLERLTDGVVFRDNGLDLDMSDLPVPELTVDN